MKPKTYLNERMGYVTPALDICAVEMQSGFAVSYDPTDAIEKPGSDQDYEEW